MSDGIPATSPPQPPMIPVGIGTKLGVAAAALASFLGVVSNLLHGDQTPETIGALIVTATSLYAVIRGRMDQATAAYSQLPSLAIGGYAQPVKDRA